MHTNSVPESNHRSLAALVTELKNEVSEFVETRIALLKAESLRRFSFLLPINARVAP